MRQPANRRLTSPCADSAASHFVFGNHSDLREYLRIGLLFTDEVLCMLRAGRSIFHDRRLSVARYLRLRHLVPHASAIPRTGPIDGELAQNRLPTQHRRHGARVQPRAVCADAIGSGLHNGAAVC
ncbi:hypothetical protein BH11PSE9_BH11PSE9_10600 [soil metagenome]